MLLLNVMVLNSQLTLQSWRNLRFLFFDLIQPNGLTGFIIGEYEYMREPR